MPEPSQHHRLPPGFCASSIAGTCTNIHFGRNIFICHHPTSTESLKSSTECSTGNLKVLLESSFHGGWYQKEELCFSYPLQDGALCLAGNAPLYSFVGVIPWQKSIFAGIWRSWLFNYRLLLHGNSLEVTGKTAVLLRAHSRRSSPPPYRYRHTPPATSNEAKILSITYCFVQAKAASFTSLNLQTAMTWKRWREKPTKVKTKVVPYQSRLQILDCGFQTPPTVWEHELGLLEHIFLTERMAKAHFVIWVDARKKGCWSHSI